MGWLVVTLLFTLFLAYANGANDNFKGVATLYGSKSATYRTALIWTSIATILRLPVSTTHALIGALAGAGWMASTTGINGGRLAEKFFLPLIAGPVISVGLAILVYPIFQ